MRSPGQIVGHLAPTATIGLLLQYLTSNKKNALLHLSNNVYDVSDILCMFMKFAEP